MKFQLIYFLILFSISNTLFGQTDSVRKTPTKVTVLLGTCATLKMYKTYRSKSPQATYLGPSFAVYKSKTKNNHYMFQSGLEYSMARYHFSWISDSEGKYSKYYSNAEIIVHTITIPAYFNLLLFNRSTYLGIGPNFNIYPYTTVSGDRSYAPYGRAKDIGIQYTLIDVGATAKIGYNKKLGKGNLCFESQLKSGIRDVFSDSYDLINQYVCVLAGYTF